MNISDVYKKLRQNKTLTGAECAALEEHERAVEARSAARAACGPAPRTVMDLDVARETWATDRREHPFDYVMPSVKPITRVPTPICANCGRHENQHSVPFEYATLGRDCREGFQPTWTEVTS